MRGNVNLRAANLKRDAERNIRLAIEHAADLRSVNFVAVERAAMSSILSSCHYLDWRFELVVVGEDQFVEAVYYNARLRKQHGQPLWLPLNATRSEIILAAWHTVVAAIEYEARHIFTYHDELICHPQCGILVT